MIDYTLNAQTRPDLVSAIAPAMNPPIGYIGHRLFPISWTADKLGYIYYKTLVTDSAAQTGRSAGTAPTTTVLTSSNTTFTCAEVYKRYGIPPDEVKELGGIESADRHGALASIRSVWRAFETAVAATAIQSTSHSAGYQLVAGHVLTGLQEAAQTTRRYPGKLVLFCSWDWWLDFIEQSDVAEKIVVTFGNAGLTAVQNMSAQPEGLLRMMATIMQFDEILIGDNDHWKVSGYEEDAIIAKVLPAGLNTNQDEIRQAYKLDPLYGVAKWYTPDVSGLQLPEGQKVADMTVNGSALQLTAFQLRTYWDNINVLNTYDAFAWYGLNILNAAASRVVKLPAGQTYATTTSHA